MSTRIEITSYQNQNVTIIVPFAPELATKEPSHCPLLLSYAWPFCAMVEPEKIDPIKNLQGVTKNAY